MNRAQADTGANRSEMQRFVQTHPRHARRHGVQQAGAVVHAQGVALLGGVDIPSGPADGVLADIVLDAAYGSKTTFSECEVFKIDDLAAFYLDSIVGNASLVGFRDDFIRNGSIGGLGAATVGLIEQSSNIGYDGGNDTYNGATIDLPGFWDDSGSQTFRPKPAWLNRLVFFDIANDSPNPGDTNYTTNHFLADLQGTRRSARPSAPSASSPIRA